MNPYWFDIKLIGPTSITVTSHERHGVSNHRQIDYWFNNLLRLTTKKTPELHITGPSGGSPSVTRGSPHSRASNTYSKVHETNTGPTWVLSAPGGPHIGPMNLAIRDAFPGHDVTMLVVRQSLVHCYTYSTSKRSCTRFTFLLWFGTP